MTIDEQTQRLDLMEARLNELATRCARILSALDRTVGRLRVTNNHNVIVIDRNDAHSRAAWDDIEARVKPLEDFYNDSIYGHGD